MPVAFDPPQARLDEDQRTGHPALFLVRRAPVIHLVGELAELGIQGFQTIGGLETDPQHGEYAQPMERECLLESLVQAVGSREVARAQFLSEPPQRRTGFRLRRSLIGLLKPSPPGGLLRFREVADHVLALVPLTALDQGLGAEHRLNGCA